MIFYGGLFEIMYLWPKTQTYNCGFVYLSPNVTFFIYLFVLCFLFTHLHVLQVIIFTIIAVVAHSVVACFCFFVCFPTIINILA